MAYCPNCGSEVEHAIEMLSPVKQEVNAEVEIARINREADVEIARIQASGIRKETEAFVEIAEIEAVADMAETEAKADLLDELMTPPEPEPAEVVVVDPAEGSEPEPEPEPEGEPPAAEPIAASSQRSNAWW